MERVKFGDIVREVKVQVDRNNNPYMHYVAGDHMDSMDLTIRRKGSFATDDVGPAFIRIFKPGQVLYGSRRTYLKKIAVADFEGICSNTTFVLETKDSNVFLQELLPFVMLSESFTKWSISHSKGSTNPYVLFSDLANYEFTLPSLSEQKLLADKLWAAYRVKESYKKLLAATDDMLKAKFIEMFGNPLDATDSEKVKLGEICTINPRKDKKIELDINVSFFPMDKIFEDGRYTELPIRPYLEVSKGFTYAEEGDVIFAKITPCMENGKGMILKNLANKVGFGSTEFHVLRPLENTSTAEFLYVLLSLPQFRIEAAKNMTGTGGQRRVPTSFLSDFHILPPSMPLQEEFANIYTQAEATKESLRKSIENIDQVIKSLINQ